MHNYDSIPIDLRKVKFSRFGSWLVWLLDDDRPDTALLLKTLYQEKPYGGGPNEVCRLQLLDENEATPLDFQNLDANPAVFEAQTEKGTLAVCMPEPNLIRIKLTGDIRLRLQWNINQNNLTPTAEGNWRLIGWNLGCKFRTSMIKGKLEMTSLEDNSIYKKGVTAVLTPEDGIAEIALHQFKTEILHQQHRESFADCVNKVNQEFQDYLAKTPAPEGDYQASRAYAAYVNWSATVNPEGLVSHTGALMSNNWMRNLWNWDTFFNVMALSVKNPDLAWESVLLYFENQAEDGQLPGYINNAEVNYTRPQAPMHGWALGWMLKHSDMLTDKRIAWLYPRLEKLLNWWFTYRDDQQSGFPFNVFPSDSGWDHCTALFQNCPNQSPDVSAFLVIMMETLAAFARKLGKEEIAAEWEQKADNLAARIVATFWDGRRFRCPQAYTGHENDGDCLYNFRPLLLGHKLPAAVADTIEKELSEEGRFLTPYGLATESLRSSYYIEDGYWRGAIWAPTMFIFIDGLKRAGKTEFARELTNRFCRMCNSEGFSENYNATTGKCVRDPAYTWTSSIYLILASFYA